MKILHVICSLDLEGGGPAQGVRNLTYYYEDFDVAPTVLTMDDSDTKLENCSHLEVIRLGKGKGNFSYHPEIVNWLKHYADGYDAVVVHGIWQFHSLAVYKVLKNKQIPYYIFPHGMLDPWFKKEYPLKHLKKYAFWILAQYNVLKYAKGVLFTCEEEKLLARKSFWPYKANEVVINYGTMVTNIASKASPENFYERYPNLKNKKLFLFMSRIHEKKGCDILIEAFSIVSKSNSNIHLVMAGPDQNSWKSELRSLAAKLDVEEHLTWTGMLKDEVKWGAIKAAEAFILPSHQENFGIAVAESLAVGTPVLISNKVNIWREVEEMEAGIVDEDTVNGTKNLLKNWLALSDEIKQRISRNAIDCYNTKFDIRKASENLVKLIRKEFK